MHGVSICLKLVIDHVPALTVFYEGYCRHETRHKSIKLAIHFKVILS